MFFQLPEKTNTHGNGTSPCLIEDTCSNGCLFHRHVSFQGVRDTREGVVDVWIWFCWYFRNPSNGLCNLGIFFKQPVDKFSFDQLAIYPYINYLSSAETSSKSTVFRHFVVPTQLPPVCLSLCSPNRKTTTWFCWGHMTFPLLEWIFQVAPSKNNDLLEPDVGFTLIFAHGFSFRTSIFLGWQPPRNISNLNATGTFTTTATWRSTEPASFTKSAKKPEPSQLWCSEKWM